MEAIMFCVNARRHLLHLLCKDSDNACGLRNQNTSM